MLNLRRTFWKENLFSCSFRWGTDVPLFTNILAIFNPLGSGKNLKVLQINMGASASSSISVISNVTLFTSVSSATDLTGNIVKYNPNNPDSIAKIYAGGSLVTGKIVDRRTINFSNGMPPEGIDFVQEFELVPGTGLFVGHESESAGNSYLPWCTYSWWE